MAVHPMAPEVGGAPQGGVVGLALSFPLLSHSVVVLVGSAGATVVT